jgi:hypothetical protein
MIKRFLRPIVVFIVKMFLKAKYKMNPPTTYAVEMQVMLDENTVLHKFAATIDASSKRDAKWQAKNRCYIKVGVVAKKSSLIKKQ